MHPARFWTLFLLTVAVATIFVCLAFPAASAAPHRRRPHVKKRAAPVVKISTAYLALKVRH